MPMSKTDVESLHESTADMALPAVDATPRDLSHIALHPLPFIGQAVSRRLREFPTIFKRNRFWLFAIRAL